MKARFDFYLQIRERLFQNQLSNAEGFDKAILSLSSAGLGLSFAFIKDIVPISHAEYIWLLEISWFFFVIAIISTLISYITSQAGLKNQLEYAEQYYVEEKEEFLNKPNYPAIATEWLGYVSAIMFIFAITSTTFFVVTNVRKEISMTDKQLKNLKEGAPIPLIQKLPSEIELRNGAPIPVMQKVPQIKNSTQNTEKTKDK